MLLLTTLIASGSILPIPGTANADSVIRAPEIDKIIDPGIPLTIGIAIANLICKDNGPIFYSQYRMGKNGKLFKMYKYRSMVVGADEKLKKYLEENEEARKEYKKYKKLKHDARVTKVGEFIRKTSLDEFPQFINVLKGDMSLVGPRPYLEREKEDMNGYYKYITTFKPGLTGLWQVPLFSDKGILQSAKGVA